MRDCLFEGRAAQSRLARLAPPIDCMLVKTGFGEVVRDRLWLALARCKRLRRAPVQCLSTALQQTLVGCILDERVLKTVGRLRRGAFDKKNVGAYKTVQSGL